jgi:glycosyl transferase family 25
MMEAQFAALGLNAERVPAVTPDQISDAEIAQSCDPQKIDWMTPQELSCSLSHLKAMAQLLETADPYALILEDDAILSERLPAFLADFEKAEPAIGIARIETFLDGQRLDPKPHSVIGGIELKRSRSWAAGAAAYVVNRQAAEFVIAHPWSRIDVIDRPLFNPYEPIGRYLTVLHCVPGLAIQEDRLYPERRSSDLQAARAARNNLVRIKPVTRAWYWLRRTFHTEVFIGSQRMFHTYLRGAKKVVVPFAPK